MTPIKLLFQDQTLTVNSIGGGIMEYYQTLDGARQDIVYGYSSINNKVGSMGDVLFPFPGRVENSHYTFEGREYELKNVKLKDGHAIHGFVKGLEWRIESQDQTLVKLSCSLKKEDYIESGFPFSLKITLTYSLSELGMNCEAKVENIGQEIAPFGLGFHPYFTVGTEKINDMEVQIKADKLVDFDSGLKPTGELLEVTDSDLDFNQSKKIGQRVIDNCYTDLNFNDKISETVISDGRDRLIKIWQDQNFPYLQVYSADTIGAVHGRRGFAVEPQTCTGFAFNVPGMGLKTLDPQEFFSGSWGVSINRK